MAKRKLDWVQDALLMTASEGELLSRPLRVRLRLRWGPNPHLRGGRRQNMDAIMRMGMRRNLPMNLDLGLGLDRDWD